MEVDVIPSAALPADGPAAVVRSRPNLVIWVMIALPAIAVIGSILLVFSSVRDAEAELPAHYAWEGAALEQDLARAQRTEQLGASMGLEFAPDGRLVARLAFRQTAQALPSKLVVRLTHALLPALDRQFDLVLDPASGTYGAALPPLQRGHWLIEIADVDGGWRLRGRFLAPAAHVGLGL